MAVINGVDTEQVGDLVEAIKARPELANVTFSVESEWAGSFAGKSRTGAVRQGGESDFVRSDPFTFESDEPPALLGADAAASAGEYALQALAACYAVTFAANAAAQSIELSDLRLELEGDFNLHGFLGLDDSVRPGMQEVRVRVHAASPNATREQLQGLVEAVQQRSPIRDTLASPVHVRT